MARGLFYYLPEWAGFCPTCSASWLAPSRAGVRQWRRTHRHRRVGIYRIRYRRTY